MIIKKLVNLSLLSFKSAIPFSSNHRVVSGCLQCRSKHLLSSSRGDVVNSRSQTTSTSHSETDGPLSENDVVSPNFINRNPRNLEMMNIAKKTLGWKFQYPSRQFYHRVVFDNSSRHIRAYVEHSSGKIVLSASTRERAISRYLYSNRDVSAAMAVAQVLAQRCKESGITAMNLLLPEDEVFSDKFVTFYETLQSSGVSLEEPLVEKAEYEPGIDYSDEDAVQALRTRQHRVREGGPKTQKLEAIKQARHNSRTIPRRYLNLNSNKGFSMQGRLLGFNMRLHRNRKH